MNYNINKHARLVAAILGGVALSAQANDINTFNLGEVLVTAPNDSAVTGSSDTVTQSQMRLLNRETVGTAINTLPGVTLSEGGPRNEQTIQLRGFDLRQVPVFIDGVPVYVSYDGYVDLARFNTFDLASVQVAKGFSSVLYGPNTLGGAINLVSRKPSKEFEGDITVGLKTDKDFKYNGYRTDINAGGNYGTWYWQASGSMLDTNRYRMSSDFKPTAYEDGGVRDNSYSQDGKINLKIGITPREGDEYSLNYISQRGSKGNPVYAGSDNTQSIRYWRWPEWDKDSLYFISRTGIGQSSYLKVRAFYDKFSNILNSYDDASYSSMTRSYAFTSIYNDHSYGASTEFGTTINQQNTLKFALHLKQDKHEEHNKGNPVQNFEDRTTSLAVEDTHQITEKLALVLGVSRDRRETLEAEGLNNANQLYDFKKGDADSWNPQAGLFYKPNATDEVHATISRKSRFPTMKDRYSGRFGRAVPNPDLDTEFSTNYELGASGFVTSKLKLMASVFYYDTTDLIQSVNLANSACSSGSQCVQFRNVGKVLTSGTELGFAAFPTDTLEIGANYTYLDRDNKSSDDKLTDIPREKLFGYGKWQANDMWSLVASTEVNSSRYSSTTGSRVSGGFGIANTKVVYQRSAIWSGEFGINNLFDRNYTYIEGYPLPGRNMFLNVTRRF
jgi:iron complex outermembrane recepter protein